MYQLKPITKEGIPDALAKAERYRLLNEPNLAESICLDILEIDPDNYKCIVILLLSITDQFGISESATVSQARALLDRLNSEYEKYYYGGIICERKGTEILSRGILGGGSMAYGWIEEAMKLFEKAEAIRQPGNDDSLLRWNTCARLIARHNLHPEVVDRSELPLE